MATIFGSNPPIQTAESGSNPVVMETIESGSGSPNVDECGSSSQRLKKVPLIFIRHEKEDSHKSFLFQSSNGTRFWAPDVEPEFKPTVGTHFSNWNDAVSMYEKYAEMSGFATRIGNRKRIDGVVTHRYLLCNKSGKPRRQNFDTMDAISTSNVRSRCFKTTNCPALIKLKAIKNSLGFHIYEFGETHNHAMVSADNMDLIRKGKKLNFDDIQFIHKMSLNKIGPSVAHWLQPVLKGGHHNMRGTETDFKNVSRDIRVFIGDRDAQMVVNKLKERSANLPNFSFQFSQVGGELKSLFWADEIMNLNYKAFGDVLAFDATYQTNTYNMIFVPFTGVDHHKKCVTFGAGLIFNEMGDSYKWLLQCFLEAHGGKQPKLILTDQDPAMSVFVSSVFTESVHRLCMWHIMKKLHSKISGDLLENTTVKSSIHKLVWNVLLEPSTFEEKWKTLMEEFELQDHVWLNDMFEIRDHWTPAYFRDIDMCCLMKTTSRCESSNAQFKINSSAANTLVQFLMCFDTSIDHQRYNQRIREHKTNTMTRIFHTDLPIERHAADVYTRKIFTEVQKEIDRGKNMYMIGNTEVVGLTKVPK